MNKSLAIAAATAAFALAMPGLASAKDHDKDTCGPILRGEYLLSASGFTKTPADPAWVPKAILELIQFNGDGQTVLTPAVTVTSPSLPGGKLERIPGSTGSYQLDSMNPCLATITFPDGPAWRVYLSPEGDEFWMTQIAGLPNTQNVLEGKAKRIR